MKNNAPGIVIVGHFGFQNLGDEAILSSMVDAFRKTHREINILVISGDPRHTSTSYDVDAILWTDIQAIRAAVEKSSLVILGGGGIFHDYWDFDPGSVLTRNHSGISFFYGITLLAKLLHTPLMIYAVGVGPLFSEIGKFYTRLSFENADLITVRDQESKQVLESIGVSGKDIIVTADPAFSLPAQQILSKQSNNISNQKFILGVAIRNWEFQEWEPELSKALDQFVKKHDTVIRFIPLQNQGQTINNDTETAKRIAGGMQDKDSVNIIEKTLSVKEAAELISKSDAVLGMRLHSIIFSIINHIPFAGIAYDQKVSSVGKRIGLDEYQIDIKELDSEKLFTLLEKVFQNKDHFYNHANEMVAELKADAEINADYALKMIPSVQKSPSVHNSIKIPGGLALSYISEIDTLFSKLSSVEENLNYLNQQMKSEIQKRDASVIAYQKELSGVNAESQAAAEAFKLELDRVTTERDGIISVYKTELERVNQESKAVSFDYKNELERVTREQDAAITTYKSELDRVNQENETAISTYQKQLDHITAENCTAISACKNELQRVIEERDAVILTNKLEIDDLDRNYQQKIMEKENAIQELQSNIVDMENELREIHATTYWKIRSTINQLLRKTKKD